MSDEHWTLHTFRSAAAGHLHGAECVLSVLPQNPTHPARAPASAAYLAHVALECAIKARLLYRAGCADGEDLKKKQPKVYDALFRRRQGHELARLAEEVRLSKLMKVEGKQWVDDDCWKRLTTSERPYSLRYGAENIGASAAGAEVARSKELADVLLSGIGFSKRKRDGDS
ncbi:MAG: hypothetical protein MJD61_15745 [Proteobacteria bacterium]|nr:hypothetical protein [Pseudomonadota bacterium]